MRSGDKGVIDKMPTIREEEAAPATTSSISEVAEPSILAEEYDKNYALLYEAILAKRLDDIKKLKIAGCDLHQRYLVEEVDGKKYLRVLYTRDAFEKYGKDKATKTFMELLNEQFADVGIDYYEYKLLESSKLVFCFGYDDKPLNKGEKLLLKGVTTGDAKMVESALTKYSGHLTEGATFLLNSLDRSHSYGYHRVDGPVGEHVLVIALLNFNREVVNLLVNQEKVEGRFQFSLRDCCLCADSFTDQYDAARNERVINAVMKRDSDNFLVESNVVDQYVLRACHDIKKSPEEIKDVMHFLNSVLGSGKEVFALLSDAAIEKLTNKIGKENVVKLQGASVGLRAAAPKTETEAASSHVSRLSEAAKGGGIRGR